MSLLYATATGLMALVVILSWLRPQKFRFLLDKDSAEPSLGRIGQFTALVVSTWGFTALVVDEILSEWYFTAYMLIWAGAQATSLLLKIKGAAQPGTVTTTETKVATSTVEKAPA